METLRRFDQRDVLKPPEGFSSQLVWHLGQDLITSTIAEKLRYVPTGEELNFILRATQRDPSTLPDLMRVSGRSTDFQVNPQTLFGAQYDTLEIGGYGWENYIIVGNGVVLRTTTDAIQLPSSDNFALHYPSITSTYVFDGKNPRLLQDAFSFSGAYTRKQALQKVAANLFFIDRLADLNQPPFIVPVPIAVGIYPTVRDEKSNPAYFIAWRVPYQGKRVGKIKIGEETQLKNDLNLAGNKAMVMSAVLRILHDTFGVTHNQPNLGNWYVPYEEEKGPAYLADFSTVYSMSSRREYLSRTQDMGVLIISMLNTIYELLPTANRKKTSTAVYQNCMKMYLGKMPYNILPYGEDYIYMSIAVSIYEAMKSGTFPLSLPTVQSVQQIDHLRGKLEETVPQT